MHWMSRCLKLENFARTNFSYRVLSTYLAIETASFFLLNMYIYATFPLAWILIIMKCFIHGFMHYYRIELTLRTTISKLRVTMLLSIPQLFTSNSMTLAADQASYESKCLISILNFKNCYLSRLIACKSYILIYIFINISIVTIEFLIWVSCFIKSN